MMIRISKIIDFVKIKHAYFQNPKSGLSYIRQPHLSFEKFSGHTRLTATGRSNRRGVWMLTIGEHLGKIFLFLPRALSQAGVDVFLFSPGIEAVLNLQIITTSVEAAG